MSDEPKKEEYVPYYKRIEQAEQEERAKFLEKAPTGFKLTDAEQAFADAIVNLYNTSDFKTYLKFESLEIAERLAGSFSQAEDPMVSKGTLGEQMAFNKGRHYQMMYLQKIRNMLAKIRLTQINQQPKNEENKS